MPKNMFFNISEEKRKMFLSVATEEFTSKSFEQVSVNSIIKKAKISRGSFYTYFDDLESLFNYLFKTIKEERIEYGKTLITNTNGNFFTFIKDLFIYDFDAYKSDGKYTLFRNYIHYIQSVKKRSIKDQIVMSVFQDISNGNSIDTIFDLEQYRINSDEFLDIIEIVILIMVNTFFKSENLNLTKDETVALFTKRISYLENGIKRNKI